MADDKNLKNIEKSLEEIQKDTSKTASDTRNVRENVSEIEKTLQNVSKKTKDSVDGINRIASNTKNSGAIEKGVIQVVSKLDAIRKLTGDWAKNSDRNKGNGKGVVGNIEEKVKNILDRQNSISKAVSSISSNVDDISYNTEKAAEYLKSIKEHIVDGSAPKNSVKSSNLKGESRDSILSISKDVASIVSILEDIRNNSLTGQGDDKDPLKSLIRKNALAREKEIDERNKYKEIAKKDKKDRTDKEKKYLKDYRKRQKNLKEEEEKLNGKKGPKGVSIATGILKEAGSLIKEKQTVGGLADKGINAISQAGPWGAAAGAVLSLLKSAIELGSERDRATSTYARAIGGGITGKLNVGDSLNAAVKDASAQLGITFKEAMSAVTEIAEARGRTTERMTGEDINHAVMLKRFGVGADALNNFDTFGRSLKQTDDYFSKLYADVSKKGLSFKNVSKAVNDNLKQAQSHTFANGLRGLQKMAETSTQLKYNMQQVFTFADKVSKIEGAISTAANLSVLGGQFAQFSNPMQLLYEGLNDMEALNDRIIGMFGNKTFWNQEKGQMDMSALDREMLKQAAEAAGLDANEMLNISYNEGRLRRISSQINPGTDKTTAEYIKNIGELDENGRAYVAIEGEKRYLNAREGEKALTRDDYEALQRESEKRSEMDKADLGSIWKETNGIFEKLDNMLNYLQEQLGRWVFNIFQKVAGRQSRAEDNIRKWAKENNKNEDEAIKFYNENKNKNRWTNQTANFGRKDGGSFFAGYNDIYFSEHMNDMLKEFNGNVSDVEGTSAIGYPALRYPGTSGFIKGPSHFNGGIKGLLRGQMWENEGDEYTVNKSSSRRYRGILSQINNGTFNPYSYAKDLIKNNMPKLYDTLSVAKGGMSKYTNDVQSLFSGNRNINGTIKVDIPQTITLNLAGAGKIGDYDVSGLVKQLVDSMMKEWLMRQNFSGFDKENFPMKIVT